MDDWTFSDRIYSEMARQVRRNVVARGEFVRGPDFEKVVKARLQRLAEKLVGFFPELGDVTAEDTDK